jgi:hypothetical protein
MLPRALEPAPTAHLKRFMGQGDIRVEERLHGREKRLEAQGKNPESGQKIERLRI